MKKTLKRIYKWLVVSSAEPTKTSMTVKGVLLLLTPQIITLARACGIEVESTHALQIVEIVIQYLGIFLTAFGGIRKIANSVK